MTLLLEIILIFMLQSGVSSEGFSVKIFYKRVGEDVVLPCDTDRYADQFYYGYWFFNITGKDNLEEISCNDNVVQSSARASRLSVSSDCSLLIRNITDEDANQYVCRLEDNEQNDVYVFLNILSISSSPSDIYGRVDLTCSLKSFNGPNACNENSFIWMDETGSQLSGKNPEFEVKKQTNCVSVLTVKHQSGNNKRFTCKFVKDDEVKIEAVYVLTDISGQTKHLYQRVGDDVLLPCRTKSSSSSCSDVTWLYQKDPNAASITEVNNGNVVQSSARASRLSVSSDCSLLITNITDEDAGRYLCRLRNKNEFETYLNTLSISKDPPEVHLRGNGSVTLQCSLNRHDKTIPCNQNSIIWMDETGSHLSGKGVGLEFRGQTNCDSVLTVKHQSGNNKRFTCKFVEDEEVKIEAVYVLDFSESPQSNTVIIIGAVVGVVLVLLVVFAILLFRSRRAKVTEDQRRGTNFQKPTGQYTEPQSEQESELTYAAVNHSKPKASSKITIKEEESEVTYSSIQIK
ncbi:vascular endothelial growth factor receptor 1 isoform X2 [Oryzias latipes]|uniref:vascular endothelial growth factor receptor 1 isoform X2 n=1 Tax=Oryzias latipes TaxID=8090 RepID=UPI000CE16BE4|nr:vascular endothelial growth factor receptor 1 isoform X2 [Oryzias latipes]